LEGFTPGEQRLSQEVLKLVATQVIGPRQEACFSKGQDRPLAEVVSEILANAPLLEELAASCRKPKKKKTGKAKGGGDGVDLSLVGLAGARLCAAVEHEMNSSWVVCTIGISLSIASLYLPLPPFASILPPFIYISPPV